MPPDGEVCAVVGVFIFSAAGIDGL